MVRDCKIASIYEGSNGIQAMDFLGRKIAGSKGAMLSVLIAEIKTSIEQAKTHEHLKSLGETLDHALGLFKTTCEHTSSALFTKHVASAFACAHPLMEAAGDIIMAWMLLWRATIANERLESKDKNFYKGKIKAAQFFITTILPITVGKLDAITFENNPVADMEEQLY
jgi:hypothetical protein